MKILVSDNLYPKGVDILKDAGFEVDVKTGMSPDELKACIGDYHGIVIRSATKLTAEVIEAATNLKVIGRAGSGLDNVDKTAATKKGIVVMNTPGGNTITTAEHTIALMVSMARNIPQATASMKAGKWDKKKFTGVELFNKTLGIVGLGAIGTQVAKRAQAIQMNVLAYDPFLSDEQAAKMGIEKASVKEVFKRSDFITLHTPLTKETKNIVNAKSIDTMKKGVRIINCARGGIVNEHDLAEAIKTGQVAGVALDVFETEPPDKDNPLLALDEVICTPHLGAATDEAQINVAVAVTEQIVDYLVHGTIRNAVNFPSIPHEDMEKLSPYITLAEALGKFAAQITEGSISQMSIEYRGEAAELDTAAVTIAAIKGLLSPILEETVNFVNAPEIAKERGIEVKEIKSEKPSGYQNQLTLSVRNSNTKHRISGTIFGRKDPRIIKVDDFPVEIIPEGTMLVMANNDRPGVIGNIGTLLGKNNINIAWMHFGRDVAGGTAMSVVSIDTAADDALIEEIRKLPNILSAKQVYL